MDHDTAPQKKTRRTRFPILAAGASRGARQNLHALERFNEKSQGTEIDVEYVDPEVGRALNTAALATERGITARGTEGRIETVIRARPQPLMVHLDRPAALAETFEAVEETPVPVLAYWLTRLPSDRLLGVRIALRPEDEKARREVRRFAETLKAVTARAGSEHVIGAQAPLGHQLAEPLYREWFAEHAAENLAKFVAGTEPNAAPVEVTTDGTTTVPMLFVFRERFGEPLAVAREAVMTPGTPLPRGTDFLVAEVLPEAVRFHEARRRGLDGALVGRGTEVLSEVELRRRPPTSALSRALAERALVPMATPAPRLDGASVSDPLAVSAATTLATAAVLSPLFLTD
jgi:hypothetical protein